MKFSKTLIELASISPKKYALQIRKRNLSLLKRLMHLKPYIGKPLGEIPDAVWEKSLPGTSFYGCPHCQSCNKCLWKTVTHTSVWDWIPCTHVKFDGVCLNDFGRVSWDEKGGRLEVKYGIDHENIWVDGVPIHRLTHELNEKAILNAKEWERCFRFVNAHIEWTKLPCWGTKAVRKLNMNTKA